MPPIPPSPAAPKPKPLGRYGGIWLALASLAFVWNLLTIVPTLGWTRGPNPNAFYLSIVSLAVGSGLSLGAVRRVKSWQLLADLMLIAHLCLVGFMAFAGTALGGWFR